VARVRECGDRPVHVLLTDNPVPKRFIFLFNFPSASLPQIPFVRYDAMQLSLGDSGYERVHLTTVALAKAPLRMTVTSWHRQIRRAHPSPPSTNITSS
jgi:hypothetical protein